MDRIRPALKQLADMGIEAKPTAGAHYKLYQNGKVIGLMPRKWKNGNKGYLNWRAQMRRAGIEI